MIFKFSSIFLKKHFLVNDLGTIERAFCECDQSFALMIRDLWDLPRTSGLSGKTDTSDCEPFPIKVTNSVCCLNEEKGYFTMYNPDAQCCDDGIVNPIGTC